MYMCVYCVLFMGVALLPDADLYCLNRQHTGLNNNKGTAGLITSVNHVYCYRGAADFHYQTSDSCDHYTAARYYTIIIVLGSRRAA